MFILFYSLHINSNLFNFIAAHTVLLYFHTTLFQGMQKMFMWLWPHDSKAEWRKCVRFEHFKNWVKKCVFCLKRTKQIMFLVFLIIISNDSITYLVWLSILFFSVKNVFFFTLVKMFNFHAHARYANWFSFVLSYFWIYNYNACWFKRIPCTKCAF